MKNFLWLFLAMLTPLAFGEEWTKLPLSRLTLSQYAKVTGDILRVEVERTPGITNETRGATLSLSPQNVAGKTLMLEGEIRYRGIGTDGSAKDKVMGAKILSKAVTNGRNGWRQGMILTGTSEDWQTYSLYVEYPKKLEEATLYFGIQYAWGEAEYRNLRYRYVDGDLASVVSYTIPENFRCEYSPAVLARPKLRGAMSPHVLQMKEQDIRDFAAWNGNLIRLQLNGAPLKSLTDYQAWIDRCLDHVDKLAPVFAECGIWFIIDLHVPPGGRFRNSGLLGTAGGAAARAYGDMARFVMMDDDEHYAVFQESWRKIAKRFRGRPYLYGYDLMNEPCQNGSAKHAYLQLQYETIQVIREIDPDTPIVVECNQWGGVGGYDTMKPLPFKDIIYEAHTYFPGEYTHQGIGAKGYAETYPKMCISYPDEKDLNPTAYRRHLTPLVEFQKKYGAKVLLGEFSAIVWAPGAADYLKDAIDALEEHDWDWCYHAFRESKVWSVEHEGPPNNCVPASQDTSRKKVLLDGLRRNRKRASKGQKLK